MSNETTDHAQRVRELEVERDELRALNVACGDIAIRRGRELDAARKSLGDMQAENLRLRAEREAAIAELARLGEPEQECAIGVDEWHTCKLGDGCLNERRRTIRVVQQEGAGDA